MSGSSLESVSAVTLATADMSRAVRFYGALGFRIHYGGEGASFTSLCVGRQYLNLELRPRFRAQPWGRVIFHVTDVDEIHRLARAAGFQPSTTPRDAAWGERFFHILDPDGHELSFARPLGP